MTGRTGASVERLIGVYDADGTLRGEVTYWLGARMGRAHCALCDITHGAMRERGDWRACRDELEVPFDTYHRDDQPAEVRDEAEGRSPVVLAQTAVGLVVLLGPAELDACGGSVESFSSALGRALAAAGLSVRS